MEPRDGITSHPGWLSTAVGRKIVGKKDKMRAKNLESNLVIRKSTNLMSKKINTDNRTNEKGINARKS